MVKKTEDIDEPSTDVLYSIPADRQADPYAYVEASNQLINARGEQRIKSTDARRDLAFLREACETNTGLRLADVAREKMNPIERFAGLMESSEKELLIVIGAIEKTAEFSAEQKKKYVALCRRTIELQAQCRADPAKYWTYVGRDQETGEVMDLQPFHLRFFDVWNNPTKNNTLIMAPVGHGKSTNLRGFATWRAGNHPDRRALLLYDDMDKTGKEILVIKQIMRSPRYRAIFPNVRVLERRDGSEDSKRRFTVTRPNWQSREPTFEGAGIRGAINGSGYNDIYCDDICPPQVRWNTSLCREINERFTSVIATRLRTPSEAHIHMIATPWNDNDVHGVLTRQIKEGKLSTWLCAIDEFAINDDENGLAIPIWPEKFNTDFLEGMKVTNVNYPLNYKLKSREDKAKIIRRLHFYNSLTTERLSTEQDKKLAEAISGPLADRWLSIDPAGSAGKASSDTGVIEGVITPKGYCYIPQVWFLHIGPVEMMNWIIDRIEAAIAENCPYSTVLLEAQGGMKWGASMTEYSILEILKEKGCTNIPEFITPGVRLAQTGNNPGKMARLRDSSSYLERGLAQFAGRRKKNHRTMQLYTAWIEGSEIERLRDHLMTFDGSHNTDGVDALTQFILVNADRIRNPNLAEQAVAPSQFSNLSPQAQTYAQHLERLFNSANEPKSVYAEEATFLANRSVA